MTKVDDLLERRLKQVLLAEGYRSLDELQADFDAWLREYSESSRRNRHG
ncbi:MAG: hypothetical protein ACREXY_05245 [Gammaproteobacteria bacterium]